MVCREQSGTGEALRRNFESNRNSTSPATDKQRIQSPGEDEPGRLAKSCNEGGRKRQKRPSTQTFLDFGQVSSTSREQTSITLQQSAESVGAVSGKRSAGKRGGGGEEK